MDGSDRILINFSAEEITNHTIAIHGKLSLKHKDKGKKPEIEDQSEQEKEENYTKIPYNENLATKLTSASTPISVFTVRDGFKDNSKVNPTYRIAYIQCNSHEVRMPVRYKMSDHKKDQPLTMSWHVKCAECKKEILDYGRHITEVEIPPTPPPSPSSPPSKIENIFTSLEDVIRVQLNRVKTRVVAVAEQNGSDPVQLLIQNGDAFGANIGKLFSKCIASIVDESDEEEDNQTVMNQTLGVQNTENQRGLSPIATALQKQQKENIANKQ